MPHYLTKFSYTPETWARLIGNPEDRRKAAQEYIESVGGTLHGFWYAFGRARWLHPVGGPGQRVDGRGRAGNRRRRRAELVRDDGPHDRRRNHGCATQGSASWVPSARRVRLCGRVVRPLDDFLPVYEFSERHSLAIDAPASQDRRGSPRRVDRRHPGRPRALVAAAARSAVRRLLEAVRRRRAAGRRARRRSRGGDRARADRAVLAARVGGRDAASPTTADGFLAYTRPDTCKAVIDFRIGRRRSRPRRACTSPTRPRGGSSVATGSSSGRSAGSSGSCSCGLRGSGRRRRREARHVRRRAAVGVSGRRRDRRPRRADDARAASSRAARTRPASASRSPRRELRAPIVPKKFFHTAGNFREHEEESKQVGWSHEIAPWIVFFQNVDAIVGPDEPVVYPEHLTEELDYELELAVVISQAGKWFSPEEASRVHRRLRHLQRHHGARHPAPRDALGRLLVLQGDRHVLPARAVDRHAGRDPRPARPRDGAARERRRCARPRTRPHERDDPGDPQPLLGARLLRRATSCRPARCRASPGSRPTPPRSTSSPATSWSARSSGSASSATRSSPGRRRTASPLLRAFAGDRTRRR